MSKLLIKQRALSWIEVYDIFGSSGERKYFVKAQFFTFGHKLHIYDYWTRQEIGLIQEKPVSWLGKAEIIIDGAILGTITRKLSLLHPKYTIDYNGWQIEGNFWEWNYTIVDSNGVKIATIDKEVFRLGDTYALTIYNDSDERDVLIMALAIDMFNCGQI